MDKYRESNKKSKKKYNSDKTYIQISKDVHHRLKHYCEVNKISMKDYLEKIIKDNIGLIASKVVGFFCLISFLVR